MFATMLIGRFVVVMAALGCLAPMPLRADPADMLLLNGRIVTLDDTSSVKEALAITGDRISATGSDDQMRKLAGADTTIIDLGGRTVIPGLIDSHIHLICAGFRYADEVDWNGTTSIADALERLRSAAIHAKPGAWLIVAGGWTPRQFTESRRPTEAEIAAVAPDHPVYVQLFYGSVLINAMGREMLGIKSADDLPSHAKFESNDDGTANGWIVGPGAPPTRQS
jgi:predicted amidohydrolase YtcJ